MPDEPPTPDDDTNGGTAVQTIIRLPLPEFEGRLPVGVLTKVNGAGQRIVRPLHLEERVVLIVEAKVSNVGHAITNDGVKRVHTLAVDDLYELEGKEGQRLVRVLREAYRLADDQRAGRQTLPIEGLNGHGPEVTTDDHGNVLTPSEIAGLQGIDLTDGSRDPVVVVIDDGTRLLWPDEFDRDEPRPTVGPQASGQVVRQLLDADTGETLAELTDEEVDAALDVLETQARRAEAAEDVAAGQELERGRRHPIAGDVDLCEACGLPVGDDLHAPWEGYELDDRTTILARIPEIATQAELVGLIRWEEANGGRKTILQAAGRRAAALLEAE